MAVGMNPPLRHFWERRGRRKGDKGEGQIRKEKHRQGKPSGQGPGYFPGE